MNRSKEIEEFLKIMEELGIEDDYPYGQVPNFEHKGLVFILTCHACPEQYDVKYNGKQVGYVRLRGGKLYCVTPDIGGKEVYRYEYTNDPWKGTFDRPEERVYHLTFIAEALIKELNIETT